MLVALDIMFLFFPLHVLKDLVVISNAQQHYLEEYYSSSTFFTVQGVDCDLHYEIAGAFYGWMVGNQTPCPAVVGCVLAGGMEAASKLVGAIPIGTIVPKTSSCEFLSPIVSFSLRLCSLLLQLVHFHFHIYYLLLQFTHFPLQLLHFCHHLGQRDGAHC